MKRKSNGFTLVELLAVIVVLGIISVVASGLIINSLGSAKNDINTIQKNEIISAANRYFESNQEFVFDEKKLYEYNICIQENLVDEGYLDNFVDDNNNPRYGYVEVTYANNKFSYKYREVSNKDGETNCVECLRGDINQDGVIDEADADIILQYMTGDGDIMSKYGDTIYHTGDVKMDGYINEDDATTLQSYFYHKPCLISQLPEFKNN